MLKVVFCIPAPAICFEMDAKKLFARINTIQLKRGDNV